MSDDAASFGRSDCDSDSGAGSGSGSGSGNGDGSGPDSNDVAAEIRASRLVYGAVLVEERPTFIECVDRDSFEDDADEALYTALNSLGADLVPFVHETAEELGDALPATIAATLEDDDLPRVRAFDRAASTAVDARVSYLLVNTDDGGWKRIRDVATDRFGADDQLSDPRLGKFVVASALVEESRDRFAELPDGVDAENVGLVQWSG
ncbi:hypothetical protein [Halobiforma nitratireducens]|uniref:Uncharacterized protein n=1 Tax=Halobiforma nitratireducens JCM 10879 TaxID=1227454 RepID=M0MLN8_9EURY|nr:hypothetical protein [Halobiforma nitratireducens]EMA46597.1 hypothetical protein C446_01091 [Halobiforma nitratireducens JCM 10879]